MLQCPLEHEVHLPHLRFCFYGFDEIEITLEQVQQIARHGERIEPKTCKVLRAALSVYFAIFHRCPAMSQHDADPSLGLLD